MSLPQSKLPASTIVRKLVKGPAGHRRMVLSYLTDNERLDAAELRSQLLEHFKRESHQKTAETSTEARTWLLNALGRVARDDGEALRLLEQQILAPQDHTLRYWALEGLTLGNAERAVAVARKLLDADVPSDVRALVLAVLASAGDEACQNEIVQKLEAPKDSAAEGRDKPAQSLQDTVRALGVVYVPGTLEKLCRLLGGRSFRGQTYAVISALCRIPPGAPHAEKAAQVLLQFVQKNHSGASDAERAKALVAIGRMGHQEATPTLLQEMTDVSPNIATAAARALEAVLGARMAALRVVEAASQDDGWDTSSYASGLRAMRDRAAIAAELEGIMASGRPEQQETARVLLYEMGGTEALRKLRSQTQAATEFLAVVKDAESKVEALFTASIREARHGYMRSTWMSQVAFALGATLLFGSGLVTLLNKGSLESWFGIGMTSGVGLLSAVYGALIENPRKAIDQAVSRLMRLKIVFLAYLRQLQQADQAFTRRLLEEDALSADELAKYNDVTQATMTKALLGIEDAAAAPAKPADARTGTAGAPTPVNP